MTTSSSLSPSSSEHHSPGRASALASLAAASATQADAWITPCAMLATRLVFGQSFALTGLGKLGDLDRVVAFFTDLGIPFPAVQAPIVATIECVGGILLLLGLATRPTAFVLLGTMLVALATADRGSLGDALLWQQGFADVTPLPFLVGLLWLLAKGAGRWSGDALLAARLARR